MAKQASVGMIARLLDGPVRREQSGIASSRRIERLGYGLVGLLIVGILSMLGCHRDAATPATPGASATLEGETESSPQAADSPLMVYGVVPPFQFTDQSGEQFDSSSLQGQVYLTTFFFTTCPTTCPQQSRELSSLQQVDGLAMVSITVQPEVDKPDVLLRYSQQYNADLTRWHFLTGTREQIWNLSQKGFMLPVGDAPEPGDMPIFHSSKIILVDQNQQIRGFYESQSRPEMAKLREDAERLLKESPLVGVTHAADEEEDELVELQGALKGAFQAAEPADLESSKD